MTLQLESLVDAGKRAGLCRASTYLSISAGTFPPAIKVGKKSFVLSYEADAIVAARARGVKDEEIRAVVSQLIAARSMFDQAKAQ